eukprot:406884-Pleurochrysis_carterae.AAC.2
MKQSQNWLPAPPAAATLVRLTQPPRQELGPEAALWDNELSAAVANPARGWRLRGGSPMAPREIHSPNSNS